MEELFGRLKVLLVLAGVVFLFMGSRDLYYGNKSPENYNTMLEADFKKGQIVEGDLYANLGGFEENYTTTNGVKTGRSKYNYMIPVGEKQYMGLLNDTADMETALNSQADMTYSYMLGEVETEPEAVHFKGRVVKMSSETQGYLRDYMLDLGFTTEEVNSLILPYYIKCENYDSGGIFALIGAICFVIGILSFVIPMMLNKKKQDILYATENTMSSSQGVVIQDDFESMQEMQQENPSQDEQPDTVYRSAFDDLDMTPNTNGTEGLGVGIMDEQPKSGLSLKLKD